jgi:hypothetical protein
LFLRLPTPFSKNQKRLISPLPRQFLIRQFKRRYSKFSKTRRSAAVPKPFRRRACKK